MPRGEGQGRGAEGAQSGLQGHRDGAGGAGCGPHGEDGGHHPEGPAAAGILPGQTGTQTDGRFIITSTATDLFL